MSISIAEGECSSDGYLACKLNGGGGDRGLMGRLGSDHWSVASVEEALQIRWAIDDHHNSRAIRVQGLSFDLEQSWALREDENLCFREPNINIRDPLNNLFISASEFCRLQSPNFGPF